MIAKIIRKVNKSLNNSFIFTLYVSILRIIDGNFGNSKRYYYYKKKLKYLGDNVCIDTGVFIYGMEWVSIQSNTHIDKNCIIIGSRPDIDLSKRAVKHHSLMDNRVNIGEVIIGRDCHISQNTMIYGYGGVYIGNNCVMSTGSKVYSLTSMSVNPFDDTEIISIVPYSGISPTLIGKVIIEDNVWLGINTVISPGVKIGENSFVRSNSFVLKSFKNNSYIAGDPAIYIKPRFNKKEL